MADVDVSSNRDRRFGAAQEKGSAGPGPRYLLPFEVAKKIGPLDVDVEAGYFIPVHGPKERILGFVAGRTLTERLELDAEIYDDRAKEGLSRSVTLDLGGRYKLGRGFFALFMFGRSLNGFAYGQPAFTGYLGIQILLSNYGGTLTSEP